MKIGMNRNPRKDKPNEWCSSGFFPAIFIVNRIELKNLQEYYEVVKRFLGKEEKRFCEQIDLSVKKLKLKRKDADSFYEAHQDEFDKWHSSFPDTILATVIIAACARFESGMTDVCKDLERDDYSLQYKWNLGKKNGLEKARDFLEKNLSIFVMEHPSWKRINQYFEVRNCFAHGYGNIDLMYENRKASLRKAIAELKEFGIEEDHISRVKISLPFIEKIFSDMISFWVDLEDAFKANAIVGPVHWKSENETAR